MSQLQQPPESSEPKFSFEQLKTLSGLVEDFDRMSTGELIVILSRIINLKSNDPGTQMNSKMFEFLKKVIYQDELNTEEGRSAMYPIYYQKLVEEGIDIKQIPYILQILAISDNSWQTLSYFLKREIEAAIRLLINAQQNQVKIADQPKHEEAQRIIRIFYLDHPFYNFGIALTLAGRLDAQDLMNSQSYKEAEECSEEILELLINSIKVPEISPLRDEIRYLISNGNIGTHTSRIQLVNRLISLSKNIDHFQIQIYLFLLSSERVWEKIKKVLIETQAQDLRKNNGPLN